MNDTGRKALERQVLGYVLAHGRKDPDVVGRVLALETWSDGYGWLVSALRLVDANGLPPSVSAVVETLRQVPSTPEDAAEQIEQLTRTGQDGDPTRIRREELAALEREGRRLRLRNALQSLLALSSEKDPDEVVEEMRVRLDALTEGPPGTLARFNVHEQMERIRRRHSGAEEPVPLPWPDLGPVFGGGLWPGVHVLAGRAGSGKTQLALQLARNAASLGTPVAYVSVGLDELSLVARLCALDATALDGATLWWSDLAEGRASEQDLSRAQEAAERIADLPILFEAVGATWSCSGLRRIGRQLARRFAAARSRLIIVDAVQLVGGGAEPGSSTALQLLASMAREVARDFGCAVVLVAATDETPGEIRQRVRLAGLYHLNGRGYMENAEALMDLVRHGRELEDAADSLTVVMRVPRGARLMPPAQVILLTPKRRSGIPGWFPFTFNGARFTSLSEDSLRPVAAWSHGRKSDKERESGASKDRKAERESENGSEDAKRSHKPKSPR